MIFCESMMSQGHVWLKSLALLHHAAINSLSSFTERRGRKGTAYVSLDFCVKCSFSICRGFSTVYQITKRLSPIFIMTQGYFN